VRFSGENGAIPWSSLSFQGAPTPRFVVDLSRDDLRNAPPLQGDGLRDVKKDVLGAKVIDAQGKDLGTVHDLVASFSTGAIDAVVIETGKHAAPEGGACGRLECGPPGAGREGPRPVALDRTASAGACHDDEGSGRGARQRQRSVRLQPSAGGAREQDRRPPDGAVDPPVNRWVVACLTLGFVRL
jgi:hypothetical protein